MYRTLNSIWLVIRMRPSFQIFEQFPGNWGKDFSIKRRGMWHYQAIQPESRLYRSFQAISWKAEKFGQNNVVVPGNCFRPLGKVFFERPTFQTTSNILWFSPLATDFFQIKLWSKQFTNETFRTSKEDCYTAGNTKIWSEQFISNWRIRFWKINWLSI